MIPLNKTNVFVTFSMFTMFFLRDLATVSSQFTSLARLRNNVHGRARQVLLKEINDIDFTRGKPNNTPAVMEVNKDSKSTNSLSNMIQTTRLENDNAGDFIRRLSLHCSLKDNLCSNKLRRREKVVNSNNTPIRGQSNLEQPATNIVNYTNKVDNDINNNNSSNSKDYDPNLANMLITLELFWESMNEKRRRYESY